MPAVSRLESLADVPKIQAELDVIIGGLTKVDDTIKSISKVTIAYTNSTAIADQKKAINDLIIANKEIDKSNKQLAQTANQLKIKNLELAAAQKQLTIDTKKGNEERKQQINLQKEEAIAAKKSAQAMVLAGREKVLAMQAEEREAEKLRQKKAQVNQQSMGNYTIPQGSGQTGTGGTVPNNGKSKEQVQIEKEIAATRARTNMVTSEGNKILIEEKLILAQTTQQMKLLVMEQNAEEGSLEQMKIRLQRLTIEWDRMNEAQRNSAAGMQVKTALTDTTREVVKLDAETGRFSKNVGNYTDSIKKAYSGLRVLANILPGFGIGGLVLIAFKAIEGIITTLTSGNRVISEFSRNATNLNTVMADSKQAFVEAKKTVSTLRNEIKLAKDGFYEKDEVVKHYNDTIGKTTGLVTNINDAEQALNKNADEYVKFTLLKAAANQALGKSAEAAFEQMRIEKNGITKQDLSGWDKFAVGFEKFVGAPGLLGGTSGAAARVQEQLDNAKQDAKSFMEIYDDLNKQINGMAIKDHFHVNDIAPKKPKKEKEDKAPELERETRLKILQMQLQDEIDFNKAIADNDELTAHERLVALNKNYETRFKMIDATRDSELSKDKLTQAQKDLIILTADIEREQTVRQLSKDTTEILKQDAENQEKSFKDAYDNATEAAKLLGEIKGQHIDLNRDDEIKKLDIVKMGVEAYNKARQEIDDKYAELRLMNEMEELQNQMKVRVAYGDTTIDLEAEYANKEVELNDLKNKKIIDSDKKASEEKEKLAAKWKEIGEASYKFLVAMGEGGYEKQLNAIQDQIDANGRWKDAEVDRINTSTLSEQDKAAKMVQVQAVAQAREDELARKKKATQLREAKFQRDAAILEIIINTAIAVAKAVKDSPLTFGMPWSGFAAAIGALQIATILAKPLPKYQHGVDSAPGGFAMTDEVGPEMYVSPDGEIYMGNNKPTVRYVERGTKIIPHDEVNKMMFNNMMVNTASQIDNAKLDKLNDTIIWQTYEMKKIMKPGKKIINNRIDTQWGGYIQKQVFD